MLSYTHLHNYTHTHRNTQTRSACKAQLLSKHHHPSPTAVWLHTASAWNPLHLTTKATCECECERTRQRERWNEERVCKWMNQLASGAQDVGLRVTGSHDAFPWVLSVSLCFSGCKEREKLEGERWALEVKDIFRSFYFSKSSNKTKLLYYKVSHAFRI